MFVKGIWKSREWISRDGMGGERVTGSYSPSKKYRLLVGRGEENEPDYLPSHDGHEFEGWLLAKLTEAETKFSNVL